MSLVFTRNIVLIFLISFLFTHCALLKDIQLLEVGQVDSVSLLDDNIVVELSTKIYNPNFVGLKLNGLEFNLSYDSLSFGKGYVDDLILIGPKDSITISPTLNISLSNLSNDLISKKNADIKLVGFASLPPPINKYYFSINQTINPSSYIDLLVSNLFQKEDVKINDFYLNSLSLSDVVLGGEFQISNNNKLTYSIQNVNIEFYATSEYRNRIGKSELDSDFLVHPDSLNIFDFSITMNAKEAGTFFMSKLFGKKNIIYIKLDAMVAYNDFSFPFTTYEEVKY